MNNHESPPPETQPAREREFLQNGRELLVVLRKMRSKIHKDDTTPQQRDQLFDDLMDFTRKTTEVMMNCLLGEKDQAKLADLLKQKKDELKDEQTLTVVVKDDNLVSIGTLSTLIDDIFIEEQFGVQEDKIKTFIKSLFSFINRMPIETVEDIQGLANPDTVIVAPLSAGLLLISSFSEYLKRRGDHSMALNFTTASPAKKGGTETYLPAGLERFRKFVIVDDALDDLVGRPEEMFKTVIQVEQALRARYGQDIEIISGRNYMRTSE